MRTAWAIAAVAALAVSGCTNGYSSQPTTKPAPTGGAALLGPEWAIASINGAPVVPGSKATITFEDGRVFGAASCNRFMGGYTVSADGLKLEMSQMASTMMACPDALMQQEAKFLATLQAVTSYSVTGGALTLKTADGKSIIAKR